MHKQLANKSQACVKHKAPKFELKESRLLLKGDKESMEAISKATGTSDQDLMSLLVNQVINSLPEMMRENESLSNAALAMLHGIAPKDELEGMLAVQMVAAHIMALEMSQRVMYPGQTVEGVNFNVNRATKLMRTFTNQMEALQRYRTKGKQTIQVQHIQVNDGGQAVVGNVQGGRVNG